MCKFFKNFAGALARHLRGGGEAPTVTARLNLGGFTVRSYTW